MKCRANICAYFKSVIFIQISKLVPRSREVKNVWLMVDSKFLSYLSYVAETRQKGDRKLCCDVVCVCVVRKLSGIHQRIRNFCR